MNTAEHSVAAACSDRTLLQRGDAGSEAWLSTVGEVGRLEMDRDAMGRGERRGRDGIQQHVCH